METSGIVLVAGATGGVGRRVVDILRKKGLPVRVLVTHSSFETLDIVVVLFYKIIGTIISKFISHHSDNLSSE